MKESSLNGEVGRKPRCHVRVLIYRVRSTPSRTRGADNPRTQHQSYESQRFLYQTSIRNGLHEEELGSVENSSGDSL